MVYESSELFLFLSLAIIWLGPVSAEGTCIDKNPEIILDLGESPEPEKIIYATYDSCTQSHDYCGTRGYQLPTLIEVREEFERIIGGKIEW